MAHDEDVAVLMRDGTPLLADVHRPTEAGLYPVLAAASPYPRQIQNLVAPADFIEAGQRLLRPSRLCAHHCELSWHEWFWRYIWNF